MSLAMVAIAVLIVVVFGPNAIGRTRRVEAWFAAHLSRPAESRLAPVALGLGLMTLVAALSSCAPALVTFVQPQAPGGVITNGLCPPQPDFLLFERGGLVAALYTREATSGLRTVYLSFEIPAHQTVRLLDSTLEVTTSRGGHASSPMTGTWYGSRNRSAMVRADSVMWGRTERLRYGTNTGYKLTRHDFFLFSAEFATPLGDQFIVTLPRLLVNGSPWALPRIRFVRVRRWVIMPFNC